MGLRLNYNQITSNVITTAPRNIDDIADMDPSETVALTCISLAEALLIIDCGADTEKARKFRHEMEYHFKRKVSHLLLTHGHWDHADALSAFRDVIVVISKKGATKIKADVKVTKTFVIGTKENNVLFQVSGGHSPDSAYVYYPSEKVLSAGDNLLSCYAQVFSNGKMVLDLYRSWESLDVKHIIPGHGFLVDKHYLMNVRRYFEELIEILRILKSEGLTISQVLKHTDLPEYCYKNHSKWEEGGRRHTGWLNAGIKYWYRHV
ncbi:MAG: MBL fold metallo-hydrolase [Candidatus Hodarchaeota archaeon]